MATNSTKIPKYRPYLSLEEIDAILSIITEWEDGTHLASARTSLLKTRTLASLALKDIAYTTNPRPTLNDKLGFGISTGPVDVPDFNALMNSLENTK